METWNQVIAYLATPVRVAGDVNGTGFAFEVPLAWVAAAVVVDAVLFGVLWLVRRRIRRRRPVELIRADGVGGGDFGVTWSTGETTSQSCDRSREAAGGDTSETARAAIAVLGTAVEKLAEQHAGGMRQVSELAREFYASGLQSLERMAADHHSELNRAYTRHADQLAAAINGLAAANSATWDRFEQVTDDAWKRFEKLQQAAKADAEDDE